MFNCLTHALFYRGFIDLLKCVMESLPITTFRDKEAGSERQGYAL
jgi:hypothetical protein